MEKKSKSMQPYKSMTSNVCDGKLYLFIEATQVEQTIRFAYSIHLSLLPVVHDISVNKDGEILATFVVNTPNHGE